jgi:hypothetical protein
MVLFVPPQEDIIQLIRNTIPLQPLAMSKLLLLFLPSPAVAVIAALL